MSTIDTLIGYTNASTQQVFAADGATEYAYRELGEGDVPLVLLQHFRGNLDNWDPALVDALASDRRVVTFDNVGVGATTGRTPNSVAAMAHGAIAFLEAIDVAPTCWPGSSPTRGSRSTRTRRTDFSFSTTASSPPT
jgi:hypothetical protein